MEIVKVRYFGKMPVLRCNYEHFPKWQTYEDIYIYIYKDLQYSESSCSVTVNQRPNHVVNFQYMILKPVSKQLSI